MAARTAYVEHMGKTMDSSAVLNLVNRFDLECPWLVVEWSELNGPEWPAGQEPEGHRGAA